MHADSTVCVFCQIDLYAHGIFAHGFHEVLPIFMIRFHQMKEAFYLLCRL